MNKLISKTLNLSCTYNYKKNPFTYTEFITVYSKGDPELKIGKKVIKLTENYLAKCSKVRRNHLEAAIAIMKIDI